MGYTILPEYPQDSSEWHEARRTSIGASEVAAILGLSPWQTPLDVYRTKMGVPNEIPENLAYFGHALEPVLIGWIRDKHPELPTLMKGYALRSTEYPWLTASPDVVADPAGHWEAGSITYSEQAVPVELKSSSAFSKSKWDMGVPDYYKVQVITQAGVLGADGGWLAVLHGGNDPELFWVPFEQDVWDQIVRITGEWWETHVVAKNPPEPTTTVEAVTLWPGDETVTIEGSSDLYDLWSEYGRQQAIAVEANETLDRVKLELQKAMQDAVALTYQGRELFTWKPRKGSRGLDRTALEKHHPDIVREFTREGKPTRVFRRTTTSEVETP